jgi:tRNA 2-selenouridine synthase
VEEITDIRSLLLADTPLIDTRAPVEFAKGSLPSAVNLPLMTDAEREHVGLCYKQHGQEAAIQLGHELVSGDVKASRVEAWRAFIDQHPNAVLFCFRGGLRSEISQRWLQEVGVEIPRVRGGYKAMRTWLMQSLEAIVCRSELLVIGGRTGCAKTELINCGHAGAPLPGSIDLEGIANHRGSAFGRRPGGQPSQISFEIAVSIELLKLEAQGHHRIILEDEGRLIGRCALPESLHKAMKAAPLALLDSAFDQRVTHSFHNYILANLEEQRRFSESSEQAFAAFADGLRTALKNISRRLGGVRYQALSATLERAIERHREHDDPSLHREWIATLLADYYDPMYDYQLEHRLPQVCMQGTAEALAAKITNA